MDSRRPDFQKYVPIRAGSGSVSLIRLQLQVWAGSELIGRATTSVSVEELLVPLVPAERWSWS